MEKWIESFIYREDHKWYEKPWVWPVDKVDDLIKWHRFKVEGAIRSSKFAYQRVKYGYDDSAIWNMNTWFIENAIPIIDKWIEKGVAYPAEFNTIEEWHIVLTKMRTGFQHFYDCEVGDGIDRDFHMEEIKFEDDFTQEAGQAYETCTRFEMNPKEEAEFQEALSLFTKHFYNLWD